MAVLVPEAKQALADLKANKRQSERNGLFNTSQRARGFRRPEQKC
jgi:hypothetical protein